MLYLLLTIAGLTMTWYYNLQFIQESGGSFDVGDFMAASSLNAASKSLTWDLGVAWAFAFPLFLFIRQAKLEQREQQPQQQRTE
jgi:hypothetical protein